MLAQASGALPVSGHGGCTLPEWVTVGPLENPVRTADFFPEMGAVDPSIQTFLWTPGLSSPLPAENVK